MNVFVRVAALAACLLSVSLVGCQSQTEEAATPKPLKPNVSPANTNEPKEIASTDLLPDDRSPKPNIDTNSGNPANSQPAVRPSPGAENVASPEGDRPGEPAIAGEVPTSKIPLLKPTVVMSEEHRNTCTVFMGDKFPALKVETLTGEAIDTGELLSEAFTSGKQLAVVVLWNAEAIYAREQFERLNEELVEPYDAAGLKVVSIHVGGQPAVVEAVPIQPAEAVANLIDTNEAAFGSVATGKLPRTYLLDADGNVLWMDLEYSRGTRRDLRNAIVYHLTLLADAAE